MLLYLKVIFSHLHFWEWFVYLDCCRAGAKHEPNRHVSMDAKRTHVYSCLSGKSTHSVCSYSVLCNYLCFISLKVRHLWIAFSFKAISIVGSSVGKCDMVRKPYEVSRKVVAWQLTCFKLLRVIAYLSCMHRFAFTDLLSITAYICFHPWQPETCLLAQHFIEYHSNEIVISLCNFQ